MATGLNVPRLTTVERDVLPTPSTDQIIFNTDSASHQSWNGASWSELAAGGGGGYNTIEEEGVALTQRTTIDFQGAGVTATDDGSQTIVTIPGGGGGGAPFLARFGLGPQSLNGAAANLLQFMVSEQDSEGILNVAADNFLTFQSAGTYVVTLALSLANQAANNTAFLTFRKNGSLVGGQQYSIIGWNANNRSCGSFVAHMDMAINDVLTVEINLPFNATDIASITKLFIQKL